MMRPSAEGEFELLSRRFRPALMAFFWRRLRNHADAEDLTQEVFTRLMAVPGRSSGQTDAYIFQIAANLLRDRKRRSQVRDDYQAALMSLDEAGIEPLDPSRVLAARDALGHVAKALREVPERTRTIFVLYRVEEMKKHAIADAYGISVSAVDKHLAKAMAHLLRRLGSVR